MGNIQILKKTYFKTREQIKSTLYSYITVDIFHDLLLKIDTL